MRVVATRIDGKQDVFVGADLVGFDGVEWYDYGTERMEGILSVLILNPKVYAAYLSTRSYLL